MPSSKSLPFAGIAAVAILGGWAAKAEVINFRESDLVATIKTRAQYDLKGLNTWNGRPVSDTNRPTFEENQISATWNFYVRPEQRNVLYLQVTDVLDTKYGFLSGPPFASVALTEFEFSLNSRRLPLSPSRVQFSNNWANPGQRLLGELAGPSRSRLLEDTPGWSFESSGLSFALNAESVAYGMTHFGSVFGPTSRISGGGVFSFEFGPNFSLRKQIDFGDIGGFATHGRDEYIAPGTLVSSIPEPQTFALMLAGLTGVAFKRRAYKAARVHS